MRPETITSMVIQLFRLSGPGCRAAHLCSTELLREVKFRNSLPTQASWALQGQYEGPPVRASMLLADGEQFSFWAPLKLDFVWIFTQPSDDRSQVNFYKLTGSKTADSDGGWLFQTSWPHCELHTNSHWFGAQ